MIASLREELKKILKKKKERIEEGLRR